MVRWAEANGKTVKELAAAVERSDAHLRNIFAGRKGASLALARRLSSLSGGVVPMDAFLRPESIEARQ
jgi:plasmid maintenance system antidote protein VapI